MQIQPLEQPPKPRRRRKVRAQDVLDYLGADYGPAQWHVRYSPAEELVYTILSQHTSDLNSERA
ncbi:MAG: endonuclease III, partial [Chloroflexi bacterium]|nr:endonuclease III [Chloroflexota bacterium]